MVYIYQKELSYNQDFFFFFIWIKKKKKKCTSFSFFLVFFTFLPKGCSFRQRKKVVLAIDNDTPNKQRYMHAF